MSKQSQYEKKVERICEHAYLCIDRNYVAALELINIPHIFGNVITDLPHYADVDVLEYIIKCCLRDLTEFQLVTIFLLPKSTETSAGDTAEHTFLVVTKQALSGSLSAEDSLLNQWRRDGETLTSNFMITFTDEANYLARKDACANGKCEAQQHTGARCHKALCACLPSLAYHKGFELVFIDSATRANC